MTTDDNDKPRPRTMRERLCARKLVFLIVSIVGFICFFALELVGAPLVLKGVGIVVLFAGVIGTVHFLRCTRCGANIGSPGALSKRVPFQRPMNFCPYCGTNLDEAA